MRMTTARGGVVALLLMAVPTLDACGQDTARTASTLTAFTMGVPGTGGEAIYPLFTMGMTVNGFQPSKVNPELAIGTMPYALANDLLVLGTRFGLAVPSVVSDRFILLPSAGVGLAGVLGGGVVPSAYAGVAAVMGTGRSSAFRAGVTWHRFSEEQDAVWLVEFGVVRPFRKQPRS